jgi:hypothetical protein
MAIWMDGFPLRIGSLDGRVFGRLPDRPLSWLWAVAAWQDGLLFLLPNATCRCSDNRSQGYTWDARVLSVGLSSGGMSWQLPRQLSPVTGCGPHESHTRARAANNASIHSIQSTPLTLVARGEGLWAARLSDFLFPPSGWCASEFSFSHALVCSSVFVFVPALRPAYGVCGAVPPLLDGCNQEKSAPGAQGSTLNKQGR